MGGRKKIDVLVSDGAPYSHDADKKEFCSRVAAHTLRVRQIHLTGDHDKNKMEVKDGELVAMWVMFLHENHWAEKEPDDGGFRWKITEKGKEWISKFNFE